MWNMYGPEGILQKIVIVTLIFMLALYVMNCFRKNLINYEQIRIFAAD
jgi:hypothetical protein